MLSNLLASKGAFLDLAIGTAVGVTASYWGLASKVKRVAKESLPASIAWAGHYGPYPSESSDRVYIPPFFKLTLLSTSLAGCYCLAKIAMKALQRC